MDHYYKRRTAQTSDSKQSSYYEERRTDERRRSRFGGSKGDSLYRSRDKERDGDHDNNAWNNVRQQTSTDDNRGRHQHHHQDDNDWYERQECNPALHRHHDPYQIRVDYNHGMDPWRVYDTTGSDNTHYRNDRWDDWEQTYVKELYDGSNSNAAHGNRGTEHRHRQPRDEVCRQLQPSTPGWYQRCFERQ